jgi:transposase
MQTVTTIGLDIAKSVFQVHGINGGGQVVIRRQLKRRYVLSFFEKLPSCLVGIEACAAKHHRRSGAPLYIETSEASFAAT